MTNIRRVPKVAWLLAASLSAAGLSAAWQHLDVASEDSWREMTRRIGADADGA